jgi:hypothetical protein
MARRLVLLFSLAMFFLVTPQASAVTILDLDDFDLSIASDLVAVDTVHFPTLGELRNKVFLLDGNEYTPDDVGDPDLSGFDLTGIYLYAHRVTPEFENGGALQSFNTTFAPLGFTTHMGWSFDDADDADGDGDATDFLADQEPPVGGSVLTWIENFPSGEAWEDGEEITFFYLSTLPPGMGTYRVVEVGSNPLNEFQDSFAPAPEPGSMILLGSGVAGLCAAARRRRAQKK